MNRVFKHLLAWILAGFVSISTGMAQDERPPVPDVLQPWQAWVTWDDRHRDCPTPFNHATDHICFWPARLSLSAQPQAGSWSIEVTVFETTWVPLPGDGEVWPLDVLANDEPVIVIERDRRPAVRLPAGRHTLQGKFRWAPMPQRIAVPAQIGILSLTVDDRTVPLPNWNAQGDLWLRRVRAEIADTDALTVQVYRVLEDGIPLWLRTQIELTVSGRSREEDLGWILPDGWKLSQVNSPIPVAVDESGRMKAQVRAGKWTVQVDGFRTDDAREFQFAAGATPVANLELVGFQAQAEFRMAELEGMPAVEVTQTTFPNNWRNLPVYQWDTSTPFRLNEKLRGMGQQRPEGLRIHRRLWLDSDGEGFTFRDQVQGNMQQIWRLDVATGQQLGAARIGGEPQLITANPENGAAGVEIRTRTLDFQAIGRAPLTPGLAATGWQADADSLDVTFVLPPGWRVLALFGADRVDGDWLTAWTLLDLFLLLIVSMAVFRMWGVVPGIVAFVAFGLAYHEPGAPRLTWLFLLIPLALSRAVQQGPFRWWIDAWKYVAIGLLALALLPFVASQIQTVIYPQLERPGIPYSARGIFRPGGVVYPAAASLQAPTETAFDPGDVTEGRGMSLGAQAQLDRGEEFAAKSSVRFDTSNLLYDPQSRIQTGPAEPDWTWNQVLCHWNGPVAAGQQIRPVLISITQHRVLTVLRLALLLTLAAILLGTRQVWRPVKKSTSTAVALLAIVTVPPNASAQIPDREMLDTLRQRLLQPADAFPRAAEIALVQLNLDDRRITMQAQIHAALDVAVPLPGRLPTWSPISVTVDGQPAEAVCRRDGYLWVSLLQGVHQVIVEGLLPDTPEWEWTFLLPPRYVTVEAPGWNVTGVNPHGTPEPQVFFSRAQQEGDDQAAYDQKDFAVPVAVDRHLEIGLIWQARTHVRRLSSSAKAVSLQIPLLPGERVLTSNVTVTNGLIDVRMGAGQNEFIWESALPANGSIRLDATQTDQWVESWHLVTSPVWNAAIEGLPPIFQAEQQHLIPVWHPWPGEGVDLTFTQPLAITGDTLTVLSVRHEVSLGSRQRVTSLQVDVECSLGSDFLIAIDQDAEISTLSVDGNSIPARREDARLNVPVQPGRRSIAATWRTPERMSMVAGIGQPELPVDAANITTVLVVPESRWVLWANGPLRGPAVRFWSILVFAVLAAWIVGGLPHSPLSRIEWVLLTLGLTQVHPASALIVVGWLFILAWRGRHSLGSMRTGLFNLLQIALVTLTLASLAILIAAVGEGLLGHPEMFILGNNSTRTHLNWFQPRSGPQLPETHVVSISVWFYRLLMLVWALWLAAALLRWLQWGWQQFSHDGYWRRRPARAGQ
jgi:hypothetical protein